MEHSLHAFRVRPSHSHTSSTSAEIKATCINSRRPHSKSRRGCEYCKQRRRKCDERKPTCTLCTKNDISCRYIDLLHARRSGNKGKVIATRGIPSPTNAPWPGPRTPIVLTAESSGMHHTKYDLFLLHHFVQFAAQDCGGTEYGPTYSVQGLSLAKEFPFLMHAMIAVAACHIQHLGIDAQLYRLPEAFHARLASQGLRNAVGSIDGPKEADSVLTAAMLLNGLTFCAADYRDELIEANGWTGKPRYDWLRIQIGLIDLLMRTRPFRSTSIWLPIFAASTKTRIIGPPTNNLDTRLAEFCGINNLRSSQNTNNPYFDFIEKLAPAVVQDPHPRYVQLYINVVGGISSHFIDLLEEQDAKARLLFAHWAALMCSIESWWCKRRTTRECWMACNILQRKLKGRDQELLERPAQACGFALNQ